MKRMLAGILIALPLFIAAMPQQASALVIDLGGRDHRRDHRRDDRRDHRRDDRRDHRRDDRRDHHRSIRRHHER
ncbi:MAG: hypothetical protein DSM106950_44700 [Stigonema ocellatum SAG 48.90 = DSM 106950]|nr:hypothetical protein [Stigonema ocellatum SAG 48.90 = DSM 106950]